MQNYSVKLQSEASDGYRCNRAANSVDLDVSKKLTHEMNVSVDMETDFNVGVIVGASGSGKTTLAKEMFGEDCFATPLDMSKPIIEQFPESYSYDDCVNLLTGIGLNSVPCWIRPVHTLSNGQKARAEAALIMCQDKTIVCIDEFSSVVDRTVAKAMAHCVQKFARKNKRRIVLCSCHYDVLAWLQPDWVIDCNEQSFTRTPVEDWLKKKTNYNSTSEKFTGPHGSNLVSITI